MAHRNLFLYPAFASFPHRMSSRHVREEKKALARKKENGGALRKCIWRPHIDDSACSAAVAVGLALCFLLRRKRWVSLSFTVN